ncbi:hypothetical protein [Lysobacter enzymogenes]|uniref:hypothetical protein n=1 Tax=Lysobacter enzymogenes TaxID=69 RepID=UPI0009D241AB|nr:hypothetical protein [Lysobacter enzymogenes]UZW62720.1 hypothetical protein BV903_010695 [Lysobacter enzymogenes]
MNMPSAPLDRYAVRYIEADGSHTQGPDCKNWGCAVLTIVPFDRRPLDAIVINGTAHALREPVPAMAYLLQHRAFAEGVVAAIEARAAAAFAKVYEPDEYGDAFKGRSALWCLHLQGPDEVHAAPTKEHAERAAAMVNERDDSGLVRAVAAPWPHTPDSHAEDVGRFITEWLLPRWQVEALRAAPNDQGQGNG